MISLECYHNMCLFRELKVINETTMEASSKNLLLTSKDENKKQESKHWGNMGILSNKQDVEVGMIKCKNADEGGAVQPLSDDATASSSSFGNTFSDHGSCEYESENEVMSNVRGDTGFGGSGDLFPLRKKRVTSHWRKFVQPIMWRCKWVELQIRKLQSMAAMYDKEIEKHNQMKQLKYRNFELEGGCAKSMPFSHDSQRWKLMKRRIRRRREELDADVYMSKHNLSSYFATCGSPAHGPTMDDDHTNLDPSSPKNVGNGFIVPDELLSLDFKDGYSLEQMLWKIEVSQSQVSEMKNKLNAVMTENAARISSAEDVILPELPDSDNSLTCPAIIEPDAPTNLEGQSVATFASQLMELNTGADMVKPEIAASESTPLQGSNEAMVPPIDSRKRSTDGILIYNRRAKKPQADSGSIKIHPVQKLQVPKEENNSNMAPVSVSEESSQNDQPAPKIRSVSKLSTPRNKKKRASRARRKGGSSLWNRRTSS